VKLALCNEVLSPLSFEVQCQMARAMGYEGLELAPFTVSDAPQDITVAQAKAFKQIANNEGLVITGLHWLLVKPTGLSITSCDKVISLNTKNFAAHLCEICHACGGTYLVHGSPQQRSIADGQTHADALERATDFFASVAVHAARMNVTYCIEPLSADQTPIINTLSQAVSILKKINSPFLKTMLDTSSAGLAESQSIASLIDQYMPTGDIAHVQLNDPNRKGPGQGDMQFAPILQALKKNQYTGFVAMEPFVYVPDGPTCASHAIGYVRGILETL